MVLVLGFTIILLLMALLTNHAMDRVDELNQQLQLVVKDYNLKAGLLKIMRRSARERIFTMNHMLLIDDPFDQDDDAMMIDEFGSQFADARNQLLSLSLSHHERQLLERQGALARHAVPVQREAVKDIIAGNRDAARQQLIDDVIPTQHKVLAALSQLEALQSRAIEEIVDEAQIQQIQARKNFIFMGGSALLLGLFILFFSLFLSRRLSYQAHNDPLTGISNRRGFQLYLQKLKRQFDDDRESYICLMDLDHFKQVNDSGGHAAGDALLKDLVDKIGRIIRRDDMFARIGGDEFAIVLEGCPLKLAQRVTMDIRDAVYNNEFTWQGNNYHVGISIGMVAVGGGNHSVEELISMADKACYAAKKGGRNQIHLYTQDEHGIEITELKPL